MTDGGAGAFAFLLDAMTSIRAILYDAAGHDEEVSAADIDLTSLRKDQLLWIDGSLAEVKALKRLPAEIADAVSEEVRPVSLEIFEPFYRFWVPALPERKGRSVKPIHFVVGKGWLLTISEPRPPFMESFVERDRGETLNGRLTPSGLAVALMEELLDSYRSELSGIDQSIDALDDLILTSLESRTPLETLAKLRRKVAALRAALDQTGSTVHALLRPDFFAHIAETDHAHFEALGRTHERLEDSVSRARETVIGSFDLYTTRMAQDTNRLVKALTVATVIIGVVSAAAGIFGMNFDTPFAHSGVAGFVEVVVAMVACALAIVGVAIWRRWF